MGATPWGSHPWVTDPKMRRENHAFDRLMVDREQDEIAAERAENSAQTNLWVDPEGYPA